LSSNAINGKATVSLPAVTTLGPIFTLTDAFGNVATTTLTLGATVVTLSPSSGPVGTVVTATVTGFGPTGTITSVAVGNVAASTSAATFAPSAAPVTEQGTSVFVFTIPAGDATTLAGVAGAQAVTVTDSLGNKGTATFTVTQKVTLALGNTASGSSGTTFVPASTTAKLFIQASGLKANTEISISASPNIPSAWLTPTAAWTVTTGSYSATTGKISTNANGVVDIASIEATSPAQAGQYSITISDGTTSLSTIVTVIVSTSGIVSVSPSSDAKTSTATVTYFGAQPASIFIDSVVVGTPTGAAQAWPLVSTNVVTITVPASIGSGLHTITAGLNFNTIPFTVLAPTVTLVSPSTASVGTTVTVVGTGFGNAVALLSIQGGSVTATTSNLVADTLIATFAVPNYIPGSYTLQLSDSSGGAPINSATTTINVAAAAIQITPTSGTPTSGPFNSAVRISITGSGFKAGDTLTVKFDSTTITQGGLTAAGLTVANTNGAILLLTGFGIPTASTAGAHTISVVGASGASATATYTTIPKLGSLAAVRPDSKVTITGAGFAANSLLTLTVNGTATTWLNTATSPASALGSGVTVTTDASGSLLSSAGFGFNVTATTPAGVLVIVVTDAAGNSATVNLTILGIPTITLGASNIVAGNIPAGVSISGTGFTPGNGRSITANLYQGSTLITAITMSATSVDVGTDGTFKGITFVVPASVIAGTYTLRFATTSPSETADATITVMGTPSIVAPTTAASGANITVTITGLSAISTATFGGVDLIGNVPTLFGPNATVSASGTSAFVKTATIVIPTSLFAGTYLLTITDANTNLMVQAAITIGPAMTVSPTTGSKGTTIAVTGNGFAALSAVTAKVNGVAVTLSSTTTSSTGSLSTSFAIPLTAAATNTLTITDAAGNAANASFTLTIPVVLLTPSTGNTGSTVQMIGTGFKANSPLVIQLGGQIVMPVPAALATGPDGTFIGYISVPAGLSGNVTLTATDTSNNVATSILTITTGTGGFIVSQSTMSSSAQTLNGAGQVTTSFASGSTVKVSFILQSSSGSGNVVVAVTFQQGAKVYNMASAPAAISTTPSTVSFSNLLPAGATGTWTATLQVYASDGVTPLGVTTLTFTVS